MDTRPQLDERYYLRNFESLCATVQAQYGDLLLESECLFLQRFQRLSETARCLYVRLVSRVGPLFRPEKLKYAELGALGEALEELVSEDLLIRNGSPALTTMFQLCRKEELVEIFSAHLDKPASRRKSELLLQLQAQELTQMQCDALWCGWYPEVLVEPRGLEHVQLLILLFYGNGYQGLTDFVLSDLGVARYHNYILDRSFRLFEDRSQIEEYQRVGKLRDVFHDAVEREDCEQVLALVEELDARAYTPALRGRWDRLRNRVARQLERYQFWEPALRVYACSAAHPARERRVRILQNRGDLQAALNLCLQMFEQAWCEAELDFLQRQIPLLQKKLGLEHAVVPRSCFVEQRLRLPRGESGVELRAAQYYLGTWQQVHFVENSLINTLFGLALWEEIFLPVTGAFVNPFQSAPLDMHTQDFYKNRRSAIDARLDYLARSDMLADLLDSYDSHHGVSNHWVNWRSVSRDLVSTALQCIPGGHLLAIWQRILFDPQANRSGFPDLLALDPEPDREHSYCMIEVKGPGDQLQLNQKRWLRFFQREQIPCSVAWVEWHDD